MNKSSYSTLMIFIMAFFVGANVASADSETIGRECTSGRPIEWKETSFKGIEHIANGRFEYRVPEKTRARMVASVYEKNKAKILTNLVIDGDIFDEKYGAELKIKVNDFIDEIFPSNLRAFCFDAFRINPEFASIDVIDVTATINNGTGNYSGKKPITVFDRRGNEIKGFVPVEYDLNSLLIGDNEQTNVDKAVVGIFNAGWSDGISEPRPVGLFKVGGKLKNEEFYPGLSALLCINSESSNVLGVKFLHSQNRGALAFENWFYNPTDDSARKRLRQFNDCTSLFQAGPRIIEYDNREYFAEYVEEIKCIDEVRGTYPHYFNKIGICEKSLLRPARQRTVIASELGNNMKFSGDGSLYIFTTNDPVSLYDLQALFLESVLISNKSNLWAVNIAGDSQYFSGQRLNGGEWKIKGGGVTPRSALILRKKN